MHWIIGDIHGMYLPLSKLLDEIDRQDAARTLVFCGDYVNRGPESRQVMELLLSLDKAKFCRGNHDDAFDLLLSGTCFAPGGSVSGPVMTFEHFLKYGLDQTLHSYGLDDRRIEKARKAATVAAVDELLEIVPSDHREFFHTLPVVQSFKEFFVAHAKWATDEPPGVPSFATQLAASSKLRHDVVWGRYTIDEIKGHKTWPRPGFFGHTPIATYARADPRLPLTGRQITLLDTGAAIGLEGRLTAWCVEEGRYVQCDRDGDMVR